MKIYINKKFVFSFYSICFIIAFLFLQSGCAMDGVAYLTVADKNGNQLKDILIVPLYSKSFGIGFGPDGEGFHTENKLVVTKPFVFNSGDDLMSKKISTRGVILPPIVFVGSNNYIHGLLFIKKGFTPKLVKSGNDEDPIVLTKSNGNDNAQLIDMLLAPKHDQNLLKKQFGVEWLKDEITVSFNKKDIALLKTYK